MSSLKEVRSHVSIAGLDPKGADDGICSTPSRTSAPRSTRHRSSPRRPQGDRAPIHIDHRRTGSHLTPHAGPLSRVESAVLASSQPIEDRADASPGLGPVGEGIVGLARSRYRGYDDVKLQGADRLETLDVALPVADPVEQGRYPFPFGEEDRIARKQEPMLPRVPEEGGGPARVSSGRDDLEVLAHVVALGEGLVDVAGPGYRPCFRLVAVQRGAERAGDPVAGGRGLVAVVQVLARDAAEVVDLLYVSLQRVGSVEEQVALLPSQQEGPDLQRWSKP